MIAGIILLQPMLLVAQRVRAPQEGPTNSAKTRTGSPAPIGGPSISITTLGVPITQNFDTLATSGTANTWTDDTTLTGWYSQFSLQPTNPTTYRADSGGSNTGAIYSWGVAGTNVLTERALGSVASGTPGNIFNAVKLTNNTGSTITSLDVSYNGEEWRQGGCTPTPCTPAAQKLDFQYQVANSGVITDANTPTTGWVDQNPLDFTSPQPGTSTAAAIDGNAAANRTAFSSTISVTVANGQEIWLRWMDTNDANNDHGLGIDDVSITPNGGVVTPTLNINDVTQAEGDAGTTNFNFNVSLTAAAGASGVSFTVNTADGTTNPANAGSDYVAITNGAGSITSGNTSTTVTVQVNGDTTPELNETFFVNISNITNANAGDTQGLGTITNDDVTLTPIHNIQGNGSTSPLVGNSVTTRGIVTGLRSNGFFLQEPDATVDADPNTSEGIFVFTSSAPPAAATVGNSVQVSGTVQEFIPSADLNQKPQTELSGTITVSTLTTGNSLPAAVSITAADTLVSNLENLERYEGMRVTVPSFTVIAPTQGTITESSATVSSNGVFYGVVTGVARPFREPGVNISDPLPPGSPANVPRFDENPERLRVDSDVQPGTVALNVSAGSVLTNVTGPLEYAFRTWTIDPDTTLSGTNSGPTAAPTPTSTEFTVASFNMERFFDTVNDPNTSDAVLTPAAFDKRVNKASLIIRNVQRYPDVIGVEEMENLSTLQAVAAKVNSDAQTIDALPNPNYVAYLVEGNDIGGIDVGFLVKESRISTISVTQIELGGCNHITGAGCNTYTNPNTGNQELLNDRPPLVLQSSIQRPAAFGGGTIPFTVIVNHLRSLSSIDDDVTPNGTGTEGSRVRAKRKAQAEFLANYIQTRQTNDPNEKIITVGDMNSFRINDGYVDMIGTILGTPSPDDQTVVPGDGADLVNPNQTDLVDTLPADQRYSYSFDGNAQVLDHVIVNPNALNILARFAYAREDADQPVKDYEDGNIPDRISDHDQPVAYFSLATPPGSVIISELRFRGPAGTQDEFVEMYNNTNSPITVATTDGSAGWTLVASNGAELCRIDNGTVLPARGHYLCTNSSGYSLNNYGGTNGGAGDTAWAGVDIPNGGGVALFRTNNPVNYTLSERLDAAGYTGVTSLYREGAGFPTGAETAVNVEYSFLRSMTKTSGGLPKDTGDNAADFIPVDTNGTLTGLGQHLGAPGPENLSSPINRTGSFSGLLLDTNASSSAAPNRTRDFTPVTNGSSGTMEVRRTFTNNSGAPVTRLRFRIVDVTTFPSPSGQAELRALDSSDTVVTVNSIPVNVRGTTVEQPPNQPFGGGWNTSMNVGFINLGAPLANGSSVSVRFRFGVIQAGTFRFFINIEALP